MATDKERLDWLNKNFFHRAMDREDKTYHPGKTMWAIFAPADVQGDIRRVIDAEMAAQGFPSKPSEKPND